MFALIRQGCRFPGIRGEATEKPQEAEHMTAVSVHKILKGMSPRVALGRTEDTTREGPWNNGVVSVE